MLAPPVPVLRPRAKTTAAHPRTPADGARWAITASAGLGMTLSGVLGLPFTGWWWLDLPLWAGLSGLTLSGLSALTALGLKLLRRPPSPLARSVVAAAGTLGIVMAAPRSLWSWLRDLTGAQDALLICALLIAGALGLSALLGAGLSGLLEQRADSRQRQLSLLSAAAGGAGLLATLIWLAPPSTSVPPGQGRPEAQRTDSLILHYGSGSSRVRAEYGAGVSLRSGTLDERTQVAGWSSLRTWYWGFEPSRLPLNGTVWSPSGSGPFPLILIVHGSHRMTRPSDQGYGYLAEHLARQGFITASVDENFLNGGPLLYGDAEGIGIDVRADVLLAHLRQWQRWAQTPGTPFYGRVDLKRVALIGHSRGGEAVALASRLGRERGELPSIRAVVAIAPSDGQYVSPDGPTVLRGVDYLLLQGGQDTDVRAFDGIRQYERVALGAAHVKVAVYLRSANHAQFNTVWRQRDYVPPMGWFLNQRAIMAPEQQRAQAVNYISAFLERSLHGDPAALRPLLNSRPDVVVRYQSGSTVIIGDFGPVSVPSSGIRLQQRGFAQADRMTLPGQDNSALRLAWTAAGARLDAPLPAPVAASAGASVWLDLAVPDGQAPPPLSTISLAVQDSAGHMAALPLSRVANLQRPHRRRLSIFGLERPTALTTFQTIRVPLSSFAALQPALDLGHLTHLTLRFGGPHQGAGGGTVLLDDLGLSIRDLR